MVKKVESLINQVLEDVSVLKETKPDVTERIGAEIMALNAVVNAVEFLEKNKATE